ncbi:hypothetical protein GCK72_014904 [Caenorhabditis remanei]|uniref:Globin domain-containing protein n=1 Tax=Caenorhabditis remanei TaxID=31234 RepID=A0A6A5GV10_CAERE|nr:hypothetical protein GCK72_014904 [Caenorhabditis remanei]KAF1758446.1 hypothetical protein GCK72_014904 [Caenorhabditis remanei]
MKLNCFSRNSERSMYELSSDEMQAVRDSWKRAKEREIGKHILQALIERKPQFKDYFGIHVDEKNDDVFSCREFMLQSHRIQNFLDTAVSSLGFCPIGNIHQMAYRIGQIHFYRGVNFGADNWLTFKKVTVESVTQDGGSSETATFAFLTVCITNILLVAGVRLKRYIFLIPYFTVCVLFIFILILHLFVDFLDTANSKNTVEIQPILHNTVLLFMICFEVYMLSVVWRAFVYICDFNMQRQIEKIVKKKSMVKRSFDIEYDLVRNEIIRAEVKANEEFV